MKSGRKSQVKYNPVTDSGEVILPGRHACNCEATKHALINNCLNCGRIVCEQERSGPCFTCGHLVSQCFVRIFKSVSFLCFVI